MVPFTCSLNPVTSTDELLPLSRDGRDNWGGLAMQVLDALDTLWIIGMRDEFYEAKTKIVANMTFQIDSTVSVFETTIRALGGLAVPNP